MVKKVNYVGPKSIIRDHNKTTGLDEHQPVEEGEHLGKGKDLKSEPHKADPKLKKQLVFQLSYDDWAGLRKEAARLKIPMSQLVREELEPFIKKLRKKKH